MCHSPLNAVQINTVILFYLTEVSLKHTHLFIKKFGLQWYLTLVYLTWLTFYDIYIDCYKQNTVCMCLSNIFIIKACQLNFKDRYLGAGRVS